MGWIGILQRGLYAWRMRNKGISFDLREIGYTLGYWYTWTPITESNVIDSIIIAGCTISSIGFSLAASLSFGGKRADLLTQRMFGDKALHTT